MTDNAPAEKPKRLYFKSYLRLIKNSVGTNMFRNFYVSTPDKGEFDALADGNDSCAFYASSMLVIFNKLKSIHGTVEETKNDLIESGWSEVAEPKPGDVLIWEAVEYEDGLKEHMGFSIGNGKAISTSSEAKTPIEHDEHFGKLNRGVSGIYRYSIWD